MRENPSSGTVKKEGDNGTDVLVRTKVERIPKYRLCCKIASILKEYRVQSFLLPRKFLQKENEVKA